MTETLSRAEELRNDLDNMHFGCRYYIGVLAELEQLGRTHTAEFKRIEENVRILKNNIRRVERELEAVEAKDFDEQSEHEEEREDPYSFSDGMHW